MAKLADDRTKVRITQEFPIESPASSRKLKRRLSIVDIDQVRLAEARQSFATRRVDIDQVAKLIHGPIRPRPGDVVLARVDRIRYHRRLELANGRKANLHSGDEIIVAYGDRYATDQFEGVVPIDLGPTNLIATGGVAATMASRTVGMRPATEITPVGLLGNKRGDPINLRDFAVRLAVPKRKRPQTIAVLGTSMNSGKTTACKSLIRGLRAAGKKVAGLKVTGTGSGGDYWAMADAGAHLVADFSDAGYASTYRLSQIELELILFELLALATAAEVDVAVIEVADGIFQEQNRQLIRSSAFQTAIDRIVFSAGDAMGAEQGLWTLMKCGLPVVALSGRVTMSSLAMREIPDKWPLAVLSKHQLEAPHLALSEVLQAPVSHHQIGAEESGAANQSVFDWTS
ncbi:DUF1611 domain-containing protein [Aurantiacibacter hainanensis]|uniref:DUF1611 domain-containing protein n=1 Tax=Aurantiacibacter hainanensis TaxID=3076114 RepID=UPI0030C73333